MTRQDVIDKALKKIRLEHRYQCKAAKEIGITPVHLSNVLNDSTLPIPDKLLDWLEIEKFETVTYKKVTR
jgi:transcriptional regulator with XRE-family HTH domain